MNTRYNCFGLFLCILILLQLSMRNMVVFANTIEVTSIDLRSNSYQNNHRLLHVTGDKRWWSQNSATATEAKTREISTSFNVGTRKTGLIYDKYEHQSRVLQNTDFERPNKGFEGTVIKRNFPTPGPVATMSPEPTLPYDDYVGDTSTAWPIGDYTDTDSSLKPSIFIPPGLKPKESPTDTDSSFKPSMFIPPGSKPIESPTIIATTAPTTTARAPATVPTTTTPVTAPARKPQSGFNTSSYKDVTTNRSISVSYCSNETIPQNMSSPISAIVLSFQYTLTLTEVNGTDEEEDVFLNHLRKIESVMNKQLSNKFLSDCDYDISSGNQFELLSLSSAPIDTIVSNETCGDNCRVIDGHITPSIFYLQQKRQRRQESASDPAVASVFGKAIVALFQDHLAKFGSNIESMEFRGITNNGVYDTFGTNDDASKPQDAGTVPGVVSQQTNKATAKRGLGWGATIVALAGLSLVVLSLFVIKRRRNSSNKSQHVPDSNDRDVNQNDKYTYEDNIGDQPDFDTAILRTKRSDDDEDKDIPEGAPISIHNATPKRGFSMFRAVSGRLSSHEDDIAGDQQNGDVLDYESKRTSTGSAIRASKSQQLEEYHRHGSTKIDPNQKAYYYDYEKELDENESGVALHHVHSNVRTLSYKIKSIPPTFVQAKDLNVTMHSSDDDPSSFLSIRSITRSSRSYDSPDTVAL
jgi:hypothetical protein